MSYPTELLEAVGQMFGSRWQSDLARALGVTDRTVRYWAAGAVPISPAVWKRIDKLVADHERRIARLRSATSGATGRRSKQPANPHRDPGDLMRYAHAHGAEFVDEDDPADAGGPSKLADITSVEFLTSPIEDYRSDDITLLHGDCIERMREILDRSVHLILADLPYGISACLWDSIIPLEPLWEAYRRIITPTGAIVLTASQPFSSILTVSNLDWFKYAWVWEKNRPTGFAHAKRKPMKRHEDILVFSPGTTIQPTRSARTMTYNPQGVVEVEPKTMRNRRMSELFGPRFCHTEYQRTQTGFPGSVLKFPTDTLGLHPTAKPIDLMRYLIRTYSNPGETVMDNTMGSGTTGIAALREGRRFIGIERDARFFEMSWTRITEAAKARNGSGSNEIVARSPSNSLRQVIRGDSRKVLPSLGRRFDLIVTSPPYDAEKTYEGGRDLAEYTEFAREWLSHIPFCLKPNGSCWINLGYTKTGSNETLPLTYLYNSICPGDLKLVQEIVWHYEGGMAYKNRFAHRTERWMWLALDPDNAYFDLDAVRDPTLNRTADQRNHVLGKNPTDYWYFDRVVAGNGRAAEKTTHPCQFPEAMIERIIKACCPADGEILDPFSGSGTAGRVADRLGRRSVLIEMDAGYAELSSTAMDVPEDQPLGAVRR